jgi:hypothetical protein
VDNETAGDIAFAQTRFNTPGRRARGVSLQVAILKVLSGHPDGKAPIEALNSDLRLLSGCKDWNWRMKRLASQAPDLDIFGQRLVVRSNSGWQLTNAGRAALASMEAIGTKEVAVAAAADPAEAPQPANVVDLDCVRRQRRASVMVSRSA